MSGPVVIERPSGGRPDAARAGVVKWFTANGYQVVSSSARDTHLLGAAGGDQHRLVIRADPQRVRFTFEQLPQGAALDPEALERRVNAAMLGPGVPPTPPARCPVCATVQPEGATACPLCGLAYDAGPT